MSPELKLPLDYKAIGQKIQSGTELNISEASAVFDLGLAHAHVLPQLAAGGEGGAFVAIQQMPEVRSYLDAVVLGRVMSLYQSATKSGAEKANSITIFGEIKASICEKIGIQSQDMKDNTLIDILNDRLDHYFDRNMGEKVNMNMAAIRKAASQIVPENPAPGFKSSVEHPLD